MDVSQKRNIIIRSWHLLFIKASEKRSSKTKFAEMLNHKRGIVRTEELNREGKLRCETRRLKAKSQIQDIFTNRRQDLEIGQFLK